MLKNLILFTYLVTTIFASKYCLLKGFCDGDPILVANVSNIMECKNICYHQDIPKCNWYSYSKRGLVDLPGQTCVIYSECPSIDETFEEFVTNERNCSGFSKTNLLVTNGHNGNFETYLPTEVIDLLFPSSICQSFCNYPYATHGAAIGFFGYNDPLNPTICGGLGNPENGAHSNECYQLDFEANEFIANTTEKLFEPRIYSGASAIDNNLFFSGGYPLGSNASKTTEVIGRKGEWQNHGPDLPAPLRSHCSVTPTFLEPSSSPGIWIIGGRTGESENETYSGEIISETLIYYGPQDIDSSWISGPPLIQGRELHACEILKYKNSDVIVVAGGRDVNETTLASVEFYDESIGHWIFGPDLPKPLFEPVMVSFSDSIILVGGTNCISCPSSKSIYQLTCENSNLEDCSWIEMDQKLSFGRYGHNALLIPDNSLTCG